MDHETDLGRPQPISPRSVADSSHYSGSIPIGDPKEEALARKVDEMGRQLEALKVKFDCPYEKDFNMAPAFTSEIMDEAIPPRFKMP